MAGLRALAAAVAIATPLASHAALATGQGTGAALALAAAQAVAAGCFLWPALPGRARFLAVLGPAILLAGLTLAAIYSARTGLLAAAGLGHSLLYGTLLTVFALSLRPGRVSLVTRLASRINPHFHPGMIPYTRAVTWTWCAFFAAQLAASAALLLLAPVGCWLLLVSSLHAPMAAALAVAEFAYRRHRWPGEHVSVGAMVRGLRLRPDPISSSRSSITRSGPGSDRA